MGLMHPFEEKTRETLPSTRPVLRPPDIQSLNNNTGESQGAAPAESGTHVRHRFYSGLKIMSTSHPSGKEREVAGGELGGGGGDTAFTASNCMAAIMSMY